MCLPSSGGAFSAQRAATIAARVRRCLSRAIGAQAGRLRPRMQHTPSTHPSPPAP